MKRMISTCLVLVLSLTMAGCSSKPTTQIPPVSEQVTSGVQQETQSTEPTPVVPEDNEQEQPEVTPTPEPSVTPEPTPSVEPDPTTTPEVADPTPEPTPSVEPTPEPEQTKEPEPTPEVTPTPEPTPEPSVEPTPTPTPTPEPTPEPTTTPDATIEINGGSTPTPTPSEPTNPSQTQSTWVEGQKHTLADMKEGAVVVKADGTKVVLKRDPAYGNVLGAGQGVDIFTGLVDEHGDTAKIGGSLWGYNNGVDSGKDMTILKKCEKTGEVHTSQEWETIMLRTNPTGEYKGDYDGEVFRTWWHWDAQAKIWYWSLRK